VAGAEDRWPWDQRQRQPHCPRIVDRALWVSLLALALVGRAEMLYGQTVRSGNAVTSVQQQGGTRASQSVVTRYPDGHRVRTHDGRSTDLTIQRGASNGADGRSQRFSAPGDEAHWDRTDAPSSTPSRIPSRTLETEAGRPDPPVTREGLRRRLLERMGIRPGS